MLIHSIISENDIFFNDCCLQPTYMNVSGGILEIGEKNGVREIVRLHSTNPHMYLDKRYAPCNIVG